MIQYIFTPGGKGIMRNRDEQVVKRRLYISIPSGAVAYVNGKECTCDGEKASISASVLQHNNTVRITLGKRTWCCEGFSYADGVVRPLGFDIHQCLVGLLEKVEKLALVQETQNIFIEEQKQAQEAPLFF